MITYCFALKRNQLTKQVYDIQDMEMQLTANLLVYDVRNEKNQLHTTLPQMDAQA